MHIFRRAEAGFTLLEMLLVIACASGIILGLSLMIASTGQERRAVEAERLLNKISMEATAFKTLKGSYSGLGCDLWKPSSTTCELVKNGTLTANQGSPFNGKISIAEAGPNAQMLSVTLQRLPQLACIKMIEATNQKPEVAQLDVYKNGSAGHFVIQNFPVSIVDATSMCTDGDSLTLVWTFG